jgi:BTB/POZ domain
MSDADIIIQSCDLVNFRIHKSTLSLSSPFFCDMFSLPQPSHGEVIDGLSVVRLLEDTEVLNGLLTMLYPIPYMIPNSYDKSLMLLAASQKYDMVAIQARIRAEIQNRKFATPTGTAAFRAYAIASRGGLPSEREISARLTLDFPMTFEYLCDALPLFEGWALHDLIGFRKRCRDNLVSCFQSLLNLGNPPLNIWMSCTTFAGHPCQCSRLHSCSCPPLSSQIQTGYSPSWLTSLFQQHLTELNQAFTMPLPNPSSICEQYTSALRAHTKSPSTISCLTCAVVHAMNGETFCKELENRLAQAISKVSNTFIFRRNIGSLNLYPSYRYLEHSFVTTSQLTLIRWDN